MELLKSRFQPKLPARIAGIVFWVLVLISLIGAFYYLNKVENEIDSDRNKNAYILAHDLEGVIKQAADVSKVEEILSDRLDYFHEIIDFTSVRILGYGEILEFGVPNSGDDEFKHEILHQSNNGASYQMVFKVYFLSKSRLVSEIRKNMLLAIGAGILLFGYFLRRVLHIMLTQPIVGMLGSAKRFMLGDEAVRFDEKRQDEFGYLGRFINEILDSILDQKEALFAALDRVKKSEIALSVEKEMAEVTLHSITDSVITVDKEGIVAFINPAAEALLKCRLEEAIGQPFSEMINLVDEYSDPLQMDPVKECFKNGGIVEFPEQTSLINKTPTLIPVEASVAPMKNEKGALMGAVVVIQDVSNTRKLTNQLSYQASHDALTGLYNRRKFESHLQDVLINVEYEDRHHVFLYLDLDQFKIVNDTCGHIAGDELLQQLPLLFHKVLRSGDVIARLGGDEFGVLLENCSLDKAIVIADKIREQIKDFRFVWEEKTFEIGVSIGAVGIDSENSEMSQILSSADIACYAAKDGGRNRVHVYE